MHTNQQQHGLYGKGLFALEMEAQRDWCRTDKRQAAALQTHETDEFGGHGHQVDFKDAFAAPE